ncbi:MAG TPA: type II toxin-antitoxin system VapB family antitoxin [Burkholderiaceae bacterium]|jgi:hypothetical protein
MRTNIDIDDTLMASVMAASGHKTKKEAVEAGLKLLMRQAAYREVLRWEGKLPWGWGDEPAPESKHAGYVPGAAATSLLASEPTPPAYRPAVVKSAAKAKLKKAPEPKHGRR